MRQGALAALAWTWFGMLIGVSFLATPVKFVVQDLDLPTALQVGAATFGLFSRIEWGLAVLLLGAAALAPTRRWTLRALVVGVSAIVLAQAAWLLPALDQRVAKIVAGGAPPPSLHHHLYAGFELAKAAALLAIGCVAFMAVRDPPPARS